MRIIVDANCAKDTLTSSPSDDFLPVRDAIISNKVVMVRGGTKQTEEYQRLANVWRFIIQLDRAGKIINFSTAEIDNLQSALENSGQLHSDDPHIIALAQVSGARLLCSHDQALHSDFRSKNLIDKPRGNVYQKKSHIKLLK